jgi:outer membrane protein
MRGLMPVVSIGAILALATPVAAADLAGPPPADVSFLRTGYVHLGYGFARQADTGTLTVGGAALPGAGYSTPIAGAPVIEAGLYLGDNASIAASGTLPMTFTNTGTGTIAAFGTLGTETVGFYALTAKAHLPLRPSVSPYLGAGAAYMHVFGTTDGAITGLRIQSAPGFVLQGGIDFRLSEHLGAFVDVKKFMIGTTATGTALGLPVMAQTRVDPWVASAGLGFWF